MNLHKLVLEVDWSLFAFQAPAMGWNGAGVSPWARLGLLDLQKIAAAFIVFIPGWVSTAGWPPNHLQ
jgi:hypothetical protein